MAQENNGLPEVGQTLAEDVRNAQGDLLVKKGVVLTERHMRLLKMWNVAAVQVESASPRAAEPTREQTEYLDRAEAELKAHFGDSLENEVMAEIFRIAVEQRAAQMAASADAAAAPE